MRQSGIIHQRVMEELVPGMLREGMSELEFFCDLFTAFINEGHQGIVRWGMFGCRIDPGSCRFRSKFTLSDFHEQPRRKLRNESGSTNEWQS